MSGDRGQLSLVRTLEGAIAVHVLQNDLSRPERHGLLCPFEGRETVSSLVAVVIDSCLSAKAPFEIYADDVKCSHGATVGELSEMEMFYLRTRGIDEPTARDMLVSAFLSEAVSELRAEALAAAFAERIAGWVDARRDERTEKAA